MTKIISLPSTNPKRKTISIDTVENGFIVRANWDDAKKGYQEKKFVAQTKQEAEKMANKLLK